MGVVFDEEFFQKLRLFLEELQVKLIATAPSLAIVISALFAFVILALIFISSFPFFR
ncbi:MAG: hypothetical protein Q7S61_04825 [bacterium]|nr:hypothetical protein [bacterium]